MILPIHALVYIKNIKNSTFSISFLFICYFGNKSGILSVLIC